MNREDLKASLDTQNGWKKVAKPFMIFFGRAKASFKIWNEASEKDVLESKVLAKYEYEDNNYYICAFSTNGSISENRLKELKEKAESFDIGNVRYCSLGTNGLSSWLGDRSDRDDSAIRDLSIPEKGIFVEGVAMINGEDRDIPYVVYAKMGGEKFFCPVPDYYLN